MIEKGIQRASSWGLLGCWMCVPLDADKNEIISAAKDYACLDFDDFLVADRLYGGFGCEDPNKRHIYISAGQFTYLGQNDVLTKEDRENQWNRLIKENKNTKEARLFIGDGPFTEDIPK